MNILKICRSVLVMLCCACLVAGCGASAADEAEEQQEAVREAERLVDGYADGTWCAEVEYYNPETGTRNSYDLDVEVEDNELTQINWPNGGWLDGSHFSPEDISDGECSFSSDKGYEYTVTLSSKGGCGGTGAYRLQNDIKEDEAAVTCPGCGGEKYDYETLCSDCERKKEERETIAETCPQCNGYKMEWESICSGCKDEREEVAAEDN